MKLRIQNFRSLKDTGYVDIKPLTILVGKNSSGKSSFLRHFPMLKQSFEEKTRIPLLFYGRYIDFGSYKDIKPFYTDDDYKLGFSFIFDEKKLKKIFRYSIFRYDETLVNYFKNTEVNVEISFFEDKRNLVHIKEIDINLFNSNIKLILNIENNFIEDILIDNNSVLNLIKKSINELKDKRFNKFLDIFEEFDFLRKNRINEIENFFRNFRYFERNGLLPEFYFFLKKENDISYSRKIESLFDLLILAFIIRYNRKNTSLYTIEIIKETINVLDFDQSLINELLPKTWIKNIKNLNIDDKNRLYNLILLKNFFVLIPNINDYITEIYKKSSYIAPLRATAERYYRIQHLSVDEVDPNGKNLPFFLDSLSDVQMKNFQKWTYDNFGFKVFISKIEGHYSIKIEENNKLINLSDMGFGYSQILPIIVQLWYSSFYEYRKYRILNKISEKIIVIEQPELHLHPKFQALFAEVLVRIVNSSKHFDLKLIVETHSDIIINRIGDCIAYDQIDSDKVNIVIFNKEDENDYSEIKEVNFNENGEIVDWPLGFFIPENRGCKK